VVQNMVLQLRKQLGQAAITTRPAGYELPAEGDDVDVRRFERLVREGRASAERTDVAAAIASLSDALALWRGDALPELRDWAPGRVEAERCEELRRRVEEELVELHLAAGRHHEVAPTAERNVAQEPLREQRWQQLMLALYRCGRQAEALRSYQRARAVLGELGLEPGPELVQLDRSISLRSPSLAWSPSGDDRAELGGSRDDGTPTAIAPATTGGNLLRPIAAFIGRRAELAEQRAQLRAHRLVTRCGPGGVGKTRFAVEVAWSLVDDFPDGVWFIDLAATAEPGAVLAVTASTLAAPVQPGMSILASLVDWLAGRRSLLVFDNCEHVLDAAAEAVRAVVGGCPTVTVLATSREPLGIVGERTHRLRPLDSSEGVELFSARASAIDDSFDLHQRDVAGVVSICEQLDGLPLAIELAATHVSSLSPTDLAVHVHQGVHSLGASRQRRGDRHSTLGATIAWSYELLTEREQVLFEQVSVFAGGFGLDAVREVCTTSAVSTGDVVDLVGSLVDKSVVAAERGQVASRYRMLDTIRHYAAERLAARDQVARTRDAHLAFFVDTARAMRARWAGPQQPEAGHWFDRDWDNLRAAHAWAISSGQLGAADAIVDASGPHAYIRRKREHGDWAVRTIEDATGLRWARPTSYGWAAYWSYADGDASKAIWLAHRGIEVAPAPTDPDTTRCRTVLAHAYSAEGRHTHVRGAARHALQAASGSTDALFAATALQTLVNTDFTLADPAVEEDLRRFAALAEAAGAPSMLAEVAYFEGRARLWLREPRDRTGAVVCFQRGVELARASGSIVHECVNLVGIVFAETVAADVTSAGLLHDTLVRLWQSRDRLQLWIALVPIASWLDSIGDAAASTVIFGHLNAHRTPFRSVDGRLDALRGPREHPDASELRARGASMSQDDLIELVLERITNALNAARPNARARRRPASPGTM
jgi:predicted ATPase